MTCEPAILPLGPSLWSLLMEAPRMKSSTRVHRWIVNYDWIWPSNEWFLETPGLGVCLPLGHIAKVTTLHQAADFYAGLK